MADVVTVSVEEFDALVANTLDDIPAELRAAMDNVVVLVDDLSPPGPLFGLYEGVPLTKRSRYSASTPDRITIFKETICNACGSTQDVERQVRKTVIHEVGHHFGIGDARLRIGMVRPAYAETSHADGRSVAIRRLKDTAMRAMTARTASAANVENGTDGEARHGVTMAKLPRTGSSTPSRRVSTPVSPSVVNPAKPPPPRSVNSPGLVRVAVRSAVPWAGSTS